jgi:hypothetical protein
MFISIVVGGKGEKVPKMKEIPPIGTLISLNRKVGSPPSAMESQAELAGARFPNPNPIVGSPLPI